MNSPHLRFTVHLCVGLLHLLRSIKMKKNYKFKLKRTGKEGLIKLEIYLVCCIIKMYKMCHTEPLCIKAEIILLYVITGF